MFLPVFFVMLFAAGAKRSDLACVALAGLLVLPLLWTQMSLDQKSRITALFDQPPPGRRPSDEALSSAPGQAVSGAGRRLGQLFHRPAHRRPGRLPLARGPKRFHLLRGGRAFWAAGHGLGVGPVCACWCGGHWPSPPRPASRSGDCWPPAIAALLAVEVLIHTGMTVGLLPITGLSLPLVSHGGSGLLAHAVGVGAVVERRPASRL